MQTKKLFSDFKATSTTTWDELIIKDLKGADYNKKLITKTIDGINIKPYYRIENLQSNDLIKAKPSKYPYLRSNYTTFNKNLIAQEILVENFKDANNKAIEISLKGITSIIFNINNNTEINYSNFSHLINNLQFNKIQIVFKTNSLALEISNFIKSYIKENNIKQHDFLISYSPLSLKTIKYKNESEAYSTIVKSLIKNTDNNIKFLNVDASIFKDAGASSVQELAFGLSMATDYVSTASDSGLDINKLATQMFFSFGIGSNYFIEIAKLRAARYLWAKILSSFNITKENAKMYIHSVTTEWNKTAYDPYVNVLRTTTEAMSAIIGGTDSLLVKPFNSAYEKTNDFSERIARNIQIILNEEAYFDKFIDISAGSYYIETLTSDIIEKTWDLFLIIEKLGGYNKAFDKGFIKAEIEELTNKRDLAIALKKEVILGTNQYAATDEKLNFKVPKSKKALGNTIRLYRGTEAFEELRQRTENASFTPKVLILTFGNLVMRKARASFATNFFACAGFNIIEGNSVNSVEEGIEQINNIEPDITVFCSSDDEYISFVKDIFDRVGDKTIITIAGYPKKHLEELKNIGIENFIHVKSNILETLTNFQNIILNPKNRKSGCE